jgi:hypothetical protein
MDLTEFMHGGPARLLSCTRCGLVLRDEASAAHYQDDLYDPDLMQHLYPRYLAAFERKERLYRPLLPPGAPVLEVGSHLGAFLESAEGWGWRPTGLDVGEHTTRFARRRGLTVRRTTLEDVRLRDRVPAVFLWNCFEQLPDPKSTLRAIHGVLQRHGLVVVRVPNVDYYEHGSFRQLGYNNLLGFPYQYGYTQASLARVLSDSGFEPVREFASTLITLPVPDPPRWVRREEKKLRRRAERDGDGPWIEMVCRSVV